MKYSRFTFEAAWMEIIQALPEERQGEFMKHIVSYALGNEVNDTDMQPIERVAFIPISRDIDKERVRLKSQAERKKASREKCRTLSQTVIGGHTLSQLKENIPPCPPKENEKERTKEKEKEITPLYPPLKEKGEEKTCVFSVGTPNGAHDPHPSLYLSIYLLNNWNEIFGEKLPKITKITEQRKAKINSRLPLWEKLAQERNCDIETLLTEVFNKIKDSKFLLGDNDRGWRADFDWFIQSDKQTMKILEGGYENVETKQKGLTEVEKLYGKNDINSYWAKRAKELGKSI